MTTRQDDIRYLAGSIASGEAIVERFNDIVSMSMEVPATNDNGDLIYWLLTTFGGGMIQQSDEVVWGLVWTLAGPAAEELLKEALPVVRRMTTDTADLVRIIVGERAESA